MGLRRIREIVDDLRVTDIEPLRAVVDAIARLGNGKAYNRNFWLINRVEHFVRASRRMDDSDERADYRGPRLGFVALDERIQAVLLRKGGDQPFVRRPQSDPDNAPLGTVVASLHEIMGVPRHVRAMKSSQAQVHDARPDPVAHEARHLDPAP